MSISASVYRTVLRNADRRDVSSSLFSRRQDGKVTQDELNSYKSRLRDKLADGGLSRTEIKTVNKNLTATKNLLKKFEQYSTVQAAGSRSEHRAILIDSFRLNQNG